MKMLRKHLMLAVLFFFSSAALHASVFGTVRVIVHDPQHPAMNEAKVTLKGMTSDLSLTGSTDNLGVAQFTAVPIGEYEVVVNAAGFTEERQKITAISDRVQELHLALQVQGAHQTIEVQGTPPDVSTTSSTPQTMIDRADIAQTPGADSTNSLKFITDYVPGAYMVHDQLHVRGGHQVTWAVDGVPVPNTNIASNVGPQFDPKDVDYVEAQRGAFMADYGDRTY